MQPPLGLKEASAPLSAGLNPSAFQVKFRKVLSIETMPIHLRAICADIGVWAPDHVQFVGLWIRRGFNARFPTWRNFRELSALVPRTASLDLEFPWQSPEDQVIDVDGHVGTLRTIYVFSNPDDGTGYAQLHEVTEAVHRFLAAAQHEGVKSVGLIHIPYCPADRSRPSPRCDEQSAMTMVDAIREWDADHQGHGIEAVHLVDLENSFHHLV